MAQSYLTFHELQKRQDRTGDYWAKGIESVGNAASNLVGKYKKAKSDAQKGIYSPLEDINQIKNDQVRLLGLSMYSDFKNKYTGKLRDDKGFRGILTDMDKMEMQSDVSNMQRQLEYLNMNLKYQDAAQKKAQEGGGAYIVDQGSMDDLQAALVPQTRTNKDGAEEEYYDWDNISKIASKSIKTDTGTPYLKYADVDYNAIFNQAYNYAKAKVTPTTSSNKVHSRVGSEDIYKETETDYRDPNLVKASMREFLSNQNPAMSMAMENTLMNEMPNAAEQVEMKYGNRMMPYVEAMIDSYNIPEEKPATTYEEKPATGRSGENLQVIELTERGWTFKGNAVPIDGRVEAIQKDGSKKEYTVNNGEVSRVYQDKDGTYVADITVKADEQDVKVLTDERRELLDKVKKLEGKTIDLSPFKGETRKEKKADRDSQIEELNGKIKDIKKEEDFLESQKSRTMKIDLEGVYHDIGDKMEDRGFVMKGYDQIKFTGKGNKENDYKGIPEGGF